MNWPRKPGIGVKEYRTLSFRDFLEKLRQEEIMEFSDISIVDNPIDPLAGFSMDPPKFPAKDWKIKRIQMVERKERVLSFEF